LHVRIFDERIKEVGRLNQRQIPVAQRQDATVDADADVLSLRLVARRWKNGRGWSQAAIRRKGGLMGVVTSRLSIVLLESLEEFKE